MKASVSVTPKEKKVEITLRGESESEDALLVLMNASASTWFVDDADELKSTIDLGSINL